MTNDEMNDNQAPSDSLGRSPSTGEAPMNGGGTQANDSPPFMEGSGEALQAKCDEYLAGWKRALADYENLQKQNAQMREEDRRRVRVHVAQELLPVVDNFDQAMKFAPSDLPPSAQAWMAGVQHIARQFADVLAGLGITPIASVGHAFDPNLHESGGSRWEDDKPEHVVLEEVIKGWKMASPVGRADGPSSRGDLVLRPSKVIVNQQS